jgi:hypothetical protein
MVRFLVRIAMSVTLDQMQEIFLFSESSRKALGSTQPTIHWLLGLKLPECKVDYSPASNAEALMDGKCSSTAPESLHRLATKTLPFL